MNAAPDDHNDHPVTVTLSNCSDDDARRVLSHLSAEFPDQSPSQDTPGADTAHATVWTAVFDAVADGSDAAPTSASGTGGIEGSVSLTAQGAPHDVTTVRKALERAFTVEDVGSASGDQELESQFRLTPR
ncbi:hypothetical protein ACIREE_29865 [Streptomyces sp. NPDC102467]|uniref:hypothetical protein n=1 Tax=Streptomyces sp. NPDC102467 TaxID=3366179 RepID=UPI0038028C07